MVNCLYVRLKIWSDIYSQKKSKDPVKIEKKKKLNEDFLSFQNI